MQSETDPCDFYKKGIIVLCCADDCLTFAQQKQTIDDIFEHLKEDFLCIDEGKEGQ